RADGRGDLRQLNQDHKVGDGLEGDSPDVGGEVTVAGGLLQEEDADKIEAGDARRPLKEGVALVKLMLVLCAGRLRQLAGLVAEFERESGAAPRGAQFGQVLIVPTVMGRVVL